MAAIKTGICNEKSLWAVEPISTPLNVTVVLLVFLDMGVLNRTRSEFGRIHEQQ
jgi:hypothetical protein